MKIYNLYQIDAFTNEKFFGNPAGVVTNADGLTEKQMQQIARELNNSETAFIFRKNLENCDMQVRFFTPTSEVPICGHATIAAHFANALELNFKGHSRVYQKTGAGVLPVDIYGENGNYKVVMTQGKVKVDKPLSEENQERILFALKLKKSDVREDCPIEIASTGHSKVMVAIKSGDKLNMISPNLSQLKDISQEINCNGYYVFTINKGENPLVHGRMFAPAIGIAEDPVTGNANGPLGAYLVANKLKDIENGKFIFEAAQGEAIGRKGIVTVEVSVKDSKPSKVQVCGSAVVAFKSKIEI